MSRATSWYSFVCAAFAAAVVALGTAGCFSEHVVGPAGPTGQELCAGSQPFVVRIHNFSFAPNPLQVNRNTRVTFVNCDPDAHTSTSGTGVWNSGPLTQYAKFEYVFSTPGTYPYFCQIHPGMQGQVTVVATP
jgi:plastocyanin